MNIIKRRQHSFWDPVGELDRIRREIDAMFDPAAGRFFSDGPFDREFSPTMDVVEDKEGYLVIVDLPGVDQKDFELSAADNVLTIKGEKRVSDKKSRAEIYRKKSWEGSFQRTISLPHGVDSAKIAARMLTGPERFARWATSSRLTARWCSAWRCPGWRRTPWRSMSSDTLTVTGRRHHDAGDVNYLVHERYNADFRSTYTLDERVDRDKVEAKMENGILEVTLHLKEEVKPRRIEVKVG